MKHKRLKCQVNNSTLGRYYILLGQTATYLYQQGEYIQLTKIIIQITKSSKTLALMLLFPIKIIKLSESKTVLNVYENPCVICQYILLIITILINMLQSFRPPGKSLFLNQTQAVTSIVLIRNHRIKMLSWKVPLISPSVIPTKRLLEMRQITVRL